MDDPLDDVDLLQIASDSEDAGGIFISTNWLFRRFLGCSTLVTDVPSSLAACPDVDHADLQCRLRIIS